MWPGTRFGSPFFIHYGKNGGRVSQDAALQYVYAMSPNGFWNDGDDFILGRVERTKLSNLEASDWAYYAGGDGLSPDNWSKQIDQAIPILSLPAKCGQTPPCYISTLGVYLMISWYNIQKMTKWFEPNEMKYDFYQMENFPRLSQVVVFRIEGLPDGVHTIEIVNKSTAGAVIDAFRVYGGRQ
jgi:hypothetical protein